MIDVHAHLTDKRYEDVFKVVAEFNAAGGAVIVDAGFDKETSEKAALNAKTYDNVYFSCGYHPSEEGKDNDFSVFDRLLCEKKCVALGEIGLDYHYENACPSRQKALFVRQMAIACDAGLPIVIHSRDCSEDMLSTLVENKALLKHGFLMHCYSESAEQLARYADLGGYFSFGGVITFKNAKKDRILKAVPEDRLLFETDSPYLTPEPFRGTLNNPARVSLVYDKAAEVLGKDKTELIALARKNFTRLFKKAEI